MLSEKTNAHSSSVYSVAFSPDGTKIVSGSGDKTIKVWDSGAPRALKIAPPWPQLTPAGLSGRQPGAAEREDERPQRRDHVGGVFPGRDQDRVRIGRPDDQSLGFGCAAPSNRLSLAETDASWLVWQPRWGCRARRRTPTAATSGPPTAATSGRSPSPRTGPRLCLDLTTRRSKSGIQVRCEPSKSRLLGEN